VETTADAVAGVRDIDGIGGRMRRIYTNLAVIDVTPQGCS